MREIAMKHWTIGNRGRHKADLGLDDDTVSGLHASLTRTDDGRWMVEDRNSTNGTARFVNGQWVRIRQAYVLPDERIRFGRAETTVHQLLTLLPRPALDQAQVAIIPWRQDLAAAFSKIREPAEFKKNILFVFDLISAPAEQIMRCAVRRRPVNPFSFMIFGGIIYTLITTFGLTISALTTIYASKEGQSSFLQMIREAIPPFILLFTLTLIFNVIPFRVFGYFTHKKRHFDDFMRLMAVVNGMFWMLFSFAYLFWNEILSAKQMQHQPGPSFVLMTYTLTMIIFIYISSFTVIANKYFWRISYGRTLWCYVMSTLTALAVVGLILLPLFLVTYLMK